MNRTIRMGAVLWRDGRVLLLRPRPDAPWELPAGDLPEGEDDIDGAMDAYLESIGVQAPAVEEDFSHTAYLGTGPEAVVFNVYLPTEWTGEPLAPPGTGHGWFSPAELDAITIDSAMRQAALTALGLWDGPDDGATILQAVSAGVSAAVGTVTPAASRRERGLDVLRTLSNNDPAQAYEGMRARMPGLADDVVDFALGEVWSTSPLDRRTRSLQVVAMLSALGRTGPLRSHVAGALNHGATPSQIVETLRMVSVYAGFPAAIEAWEVVAAVFRDRGIDPAEVQP